MPANKKKAVLFIVGPTATGKTSLAVRLARRLDGEIISADSMQVYKGMEVISQAPAAAEMKMAPHRLVGVIDPSREYSAASFRRAASRAVKSSLDRGRVPIVVGGSGLYVKALIDGLFPSPEADEAFRRKMRAFCAGKGSHALHEKLAAIDPVSAGSIHPNDSRRIIRALEIYHSTGKTMTERKAATKGLKDKYDIRIFGLTAPRARIYRNIDERVERMFRDGMLEEAGRLGRKRLSKTARAALGVKETAAFLEGRCSLDAAKEELKKNTRNFAKRQLTWFQADKRIKWFDTARVSVPAIIDRICATISRPGR